MSTSWSMKSHEEQTSCHWLADPLRKSFLNYIFHKVLFKTSDPYFKWNINSRYAEHSYFHVPSTAQIKLRKGAVSRNIKYIFEHKVTDENKIQLTDFKFFALLANTFNNVLNFKLSRHLFISHCNAHTTYLASIG